MKKLLFAASALLSLWTLSQPILAQEAATSRINMDRDENSPSLSDLGLHLNPQLGVSSFEYSGDQGGAHQKLSGGATVEFGGPSRKLETGLLLLQTGSDATINSKSETISTSYLTIPMMAKLRILQMQSQSWYVKFGALTAFQLSSSDRAVTNPIDVLGSVGFGGRFPLTHKSDFILEATYNRGLMDAVQSSTKTSYNQGAMILAGLSFRI